MKMDIKIIKEKLKNLKPGEAEFVYVLAGVVFLVGLFLIIFFSWQYFSGKDFGTAIVNLNKDKEKTQEENCNYRRTLDGVCVETQSEINPKLVAVMIENHSDARPQSGLVDASVVYEAPVEANYTRFMAVYLAEDKVEKIGPVRSARPYFLDWLAEYGGAMYMHVGGSNEALELIVENNVFDINEMKRDWYFWRSEDQYAPHNTYTSSQLWGKAYETYGDDFDVRKYEGWKFMKENTDDVDYYADDANHADVIEHTQKIDAPIRRVGKDLALQSGGQAAEIKQITVSFLAPVYEAVWKYNTTTQQYGRYQMGYPHVDQDGRQIMADTIVVQYVNTRVLDEVGRLDMDTIGNGEAVVFYNGLDYKGTWVKENKNSRTKFYDLSGEELLFKSGKIWVEVVNQNGSVLFRTNDSE